jgi:hypothetical protein
VVQTNHNIDTQYTASEMQIRQENKTKIRGLDNTTVAGADMESRVEEEMKDINRKHKRPN